MAKFCSQCGKPLSPDAKFCPECGAKVNSTVNLSKENSTDNSTAERYMPTDVPVNRRVPDKGFVENFSCKWVGSVLIVAVCARP